MIEERFRVADTAVRRLCIIVEKSQGFWWGFCKSVKQENNDAIVRKTPLSLGDNMLVTLTRFGTLAITRSRQVVATNGFFIELCKSRGGREGFQ